MTHDELLEAVQSESADRGGTSIAALVAVVELHKPSEVWGDTVCRFCFDLAWEPSGLEMMDKSFAYPCPTIQAIEGAINANL